MQHNWMMCVMFVLLGNVIYFTACNVEKIDEELELESIMERQNNSCRFVISGSIVSTEDLKRVKDVEVSSNFFDQVVEADNNGNFRVFVDVPNGQSIGKRTVKFAADGFLTKEVDVDFTDVLGDRSFSTQVEWKIGMEPKQEPISVSISEPTNATFTDKLAVVSYGEDRFGIFPKDTTIIDLVYSVVIPPVVAARSSNGPTITITPDHSFARGAGIEVEDEDGVPVAKFDIEASEGVALTSAISLTFTSLLPVSTGDVIEVDVEDGDDGSVTSFSPATGSLTVLIPALSDVVILNTSQSCNVTIGRGASSINIGSSVSRSLQNCNCSGPQDLQFFNSFQPSTDLGFGTSAGLSDIQQALLIQELFNCINAGGTLDNMNVLGEPVSVTVGKCQVVTLNTSNVTTSYTGTFYGINFNVQFTAETVTTLSDGGPCPTTTACHQGC